MTELKPCPFCGGEPTIVVRKGKDGWRDRYSILCDYEHGGCGAESGWYHYESEAVEAWNKRVGEGGRMICYMDRTWCDAEKCTYYQTCKDAVPYAKRKQQKQEHCQRLPYAVRDMSDDCNDYEVAK